MEKKHGNNNGYNPSEDEEFMKIIDEVLKEEEAEKINIRPKEEFEWIDIEKEVALAAEGENDNSKEYDEVVHKIAEEELHHSEQLEREQERERRDDEIVDEITNSLSEQVEEEFKTERKKEPKKKKTAFFWIGTLVLGFLCLILLTVLFLRYTKAGHNLVFHVTSGYIAGSVNYDDGSKENDNQETLPTVTPAPEEVKELPEKVDKEDEKEELLTARHEDYCVNLLLLGEEAMGSKGAHGRTDVMMIATINTKEKKIGLTSLMRDMYVQIPGHIDNKLNSAYASGGAPLLYETIELNFNIKLDGYALVGFNSFEKIIDLLSGVTVTLTEEEANHLRTSNYISNPNYRNVIAGVNQLNGNQALGYCRIRYVGTKDKENDDFGRTSRQRTVLNAMFEKYKSLGMLDLAVKMNSCLPMVTTDLDSKEIETIMKMAYEVGLNQIETLRIPANGTFEGVKIRKMDVIVPDLSKNTEIMHDFIFGK